MTNKLIVIVEGGNVQYCYAEDENAQVEVIDFDNMEAEGEASVNAAEVRARIACQTMHNVY